MHLTSHSCIICTCRGTHAVQATHANKMNVSCMHACSSNYTRQQNERLVHARVQFPMVIRHRSVVRTRKMLRAFLKTCRAVQLLHACVIKFKVSGTVVDGFCKGDLRLTLPLQIHKWLLCVLGSNSYNKLQISDNTTVDIYVPTYTLFAYTLPVVSLE